MSRAPIDLDKLSRDIDARQRVRPPNTLPNGRPRTGASKVFRDNYDLLHSKREQGASWVDIAASLGQQGVMQGDGKPITHKRAAALFAQEKERRRKMLSRDGEKSAPQPFVSLEETARTPDPFSAAKAEIDHTGSQSSVVPVVDGKTGDMDLSSMRRADYDRYNKLFKKD